MNTIRFKVLLIVVLFLSARICTAACAGQLEDGTAALKRHDYQTALKLWQPLAESSQAIS
jgi:hypothetical protein